MSSASTAEWFHRSYESVIGPCTSVFHVPPEQQKSTFPHIDIHLYLGAPDSFHLLVTAGMSTRALGSVEKPTHRPRVELYAKVPGTLAQTEVASVCRSLWRLAQWPFGSTPATPLAEWHLVHGLPPITETSSLDAFLLTMPLEADRFAARLERVVGASFLHAYGVTNGERQILEADRETIPTRSLALLDTAGRFTDPRRAEASLDELR